jgi:hypothetical protein
MNEHSELETGLSSAVRLLKERIAPLVCLLAQSRGNEATYRYLSTELKSLRGELRSVEKPSQNHNNLLLE